MSQSSPPTPDNLSTSQSQKSNVDFESFHNTINGLPAPAAAGAKNHHGINPATGKELWPVPIASKEDLDNAVASARKAFPSWRDTPIDKRRELVLAFADRVGKYAKELTDLLVKENGKPYPLAAKEAGHAPKWIATAAKLSLPDEVFEDEERVVTTTFVPLGVVGAICPWNFPITLSTGKMGPALVTGNCLIVKPSPFTPYTALKIVEIGQQVLPPGVLQALGGDDMLGPWMTSHPGIDKISFTGSIPTGKKIMAACAQSLKRVTLELGGNDPTIVLPDVDVSAVAREVSRGSFINSGQMCVAIKRIYVHDSIYNEFLKAMIEHTRALKVGNGADEGVEMGPVQNKMQFDRVKELFSDTQAQGYKFALNSETEQVKGRDGYFIDPAIIDNPPTESRIWQEEPFGPIVPLQPFSDVADVIKRANDINVGLGASVFSKDTAAAQKIADQLEVGSVFINGYAHPTPAAYFSGHKESGVGGEFGPHGLHSYCAARAVHTYKRNLKSDG